MNKHFLTAIILGTSALVINAGRPGKTDFTALRNKDINTPRISKTILPGQRNNLKGFHKPDADREMSRFTTPLLSTKKFENSADYYEKMDSVTRKGIDGTSISKQIFQYNSLGYGTRSDNYVPNQEGGWSLYSYYLYEYDDLNRRILAEIINDDAPYENVRFEYTYSDDTPYYTSQTAYYPDYYSEDMALAPYQKVDYEYDSDHRTIKETYYVWDSETNEWGLYGMKTATWDNQDRMTSMFTYSVDENGSLVGQEGHDYIYLPGTDLDQEVDGYTWENDAWLKFERNILTYNDLNQILKNEWLYWNRERQNWDGNDIYGLWGFEENNSYQEYIYGDRNRLMQEKGYRMNSSFQYVQNGNIDYTYDDIDPENEVYERTKTIQYMWEGPFLSDYAQEIQRFNKFGAETYYKKYEFTSGSRLARSEEVRTIDPQTNRYFGCYFYGYTQDEANTRYGESREEFGDYVGTPESDCPGYGMHWKGTGRDTDSSWIEECRDEFVWENDLMLGNTHTVWEDGYSWVQAKFYQGVDWNQPVDRIWMWPLDTKLLENVKVTYVDQFYDMDGDGWDIGGWGGSYRDTFFYSQAASAVSMVIDSNAVEVARYDLAGRAISSYTPGINIVKYSDGSVRKIMVK